MYLYLIILAVI